MLYGTAVRVRMDSPQRLTKICNRQEETAVFVQVVLQRIRMAVGMVHEWMD